MIEQKTGRPRQNLPSQLHCGLRRNNSFAHLRGNKNYISVSKFCATKVRCTTRTLHRDGWVLILGERERRRLMFLGFVKGVLSVVLSGFCTTHCPGHKLTVQNKGKV